MTSTRQSRQTSIPFKSVKSSQRIPEKPDTSNSPSHIPEDIETILKRFDMDMRFGPCVGLSRLERWDRAKRLDLDPPEHIKRILLTAQVSKECIWDHSIGFEKNSSQTKEES